MQNVPNPWAIWSGMDSSASPRSAHEVASGKRARVPPTSSSEDVARLPIARIQPDAALPLNGASNPAWHARLAALAHDAVTPLIGAQNTLTDAQWQTVVGKLAEHDPDWRVRVNALKALGNFTIADDPDLARTPLLAQAVDAMERSVESEFMEKS